MPTRRGGEDELGKKKKARSIKAGGGRTIPLECGLKERQLFFLPQKGKEETATRQRGSRFVPTEWGEGVYLPVSVGRKQMGDCIEKSDLRAPFRRGEEGPSPGHRGRHPILHMPCNAWNNRNRARNLKKKGRKKDLKEGLTPSFIRRKRGKKLDFKRGKKKGMQSGEKTVCSALSCRDEVAEASRFAYERKKKKERASNERKKKRVGYWKRASERPARDKPEGSRRGAGKGPIFCRKEGGARKGKKKKKNFSKGQTSSGLAFHDKEGGGEDH